MASGATHRAPGRTAVVTLRLSPEDRALLNQMASDRGLSMQSYLESVAFNREVPPRRPSGPVRRSQDEELPMTG
ncbi:plasmid mobilization protein [Serinicoccus sp. CNJ-927]|uniref:plasmid mobilization protein n=1 Tax=Serinicoccus sp. CNJ-927 TaxID=1904970 RepID=UPI00267AB211